MEKFRLQKWGRIAGFQKKIIDVTNSMILDHHRKTLSDAHSGSIFRSTAFMLTELFGEYFADIVKECFNIDVKLVKSLVRISKNGKNGKPKNIVETEINRDEPSEGIVMELSGSEDKSVPEDKEKFIKTDNIYIKAKYTTNSTSSKDMIDEIFREISNLLQQVLAIIDKECINIAYENQRTMEYLMRIAHGNIFENKTIFETFFEKLLKEATDRYEEANDPLKDETSFQIMLFFPGKTTNTAICGDIKSTHGFFFYPIFNTDDKNDKQETAKNNIDNQSGNIGIHIENILHRILFQATRENTSEVEDTLLKPFVNDFFNESLIESFKNDGLESMDNWNDDSKKAIFQIFLQYKKAKDKSTNLKEFWKDNLTINAEELNNIFEHLKSEINKSKDDIINTNKAHLKLWDMTEYFDEKEVKPAFQPFGEGVVGSVIQKFLPLRIRDQKINTLKFPNRKGIPYNLMGFLEKRYKIGGGRNPVAMVPLTSKGQLLGALYAVKKSSNNEDESSTKDKSPIHEMKFSTHEMNTLEFISKYVADNIQEMKDNFAFKKLSTIQDLGNLSKRIDAIFSFIEAIAIVTNVIDIRLDRTEGPISLKNYGINDIIKISDINAPTLLENEDNPEMWNFIIPPRTWDVKLPKEEYWVFQLNYIEFYDIIGNYKYEIERLYRTILHALGLKASGVETGNSEEIFEKIANYTEDIDIQKKNTEYLTVEELKDTDANKVAMKKYSEKVEWVRSCGRTCAKIAEKMGYNPEYKKKSKVFINCVKCWWDVTEKIQSTDSLKKIIRPMILAYVRKNTIDWKDIVVKISEKI